jgi:phosphoadenosine phosphosulfate reductase
MSQTMAVPIDPERINRQLNAAHPSEIVRWAADTFGSGLLMTSSFGADSMCAIHLVRSVVPDIRILFVNTGYLFPETLAFMEELRQRYNLNVKEFKTLNDPVVWLTVNGEPDPHLRLNVDACCAANKNEVFDRALRELAPTAWIRGVRSDQSRHRQNMQTVQWNNRASCWAVSPLLHWNTRQIYEYMKLHELPHHPLWAEGYVSIGCSPETCTRPVTRGEDSRSGRWSGMDKTECGIHLDHGAGI